MQKRAQSSIITTVLIVLVALAAVALIAIFIIHQVRDNVQTAEIRAKAYSIEIEIIEVRAGNNYFLLRRNSNNPDLVIANISVVINDQLVNSTIDLSNSWAPLETKRVNLTNYIIQKGDRIAVYVILGDVARAIPIEIARTDVNRIIEGYLPTCISFTYSSWGICNFSSKLKYRTVLNSSPPGCNITTAQLNQSCSAIDLLNVDPFLLGYWKAEGNANDETGLNNGVPTNVTYVAGNSDSNSAFNFNGLNSYVTIGDNILAQDMKTISFWAKFNYFTRGGTGEGQEIVSKSSSHCGLEVVLYGGSLGFYAMSDYCTDVPHLNSSYITYPNDMLSLNKWYYVAATQNGTYLKLYVDGNLVNSSDLINPLGNEASTGTIPLKFGWMDTPIWGYGNYRYFNGTLDEVRIYNRTLSAQEIGSIYSFT